MKVTFLLKSIYSIVLITTFLSSLNACPTGLCTLESTEEVETAAEMEDDND